MRRTLAMIGPDAVWPTLNGLLSALGFKLGDGVPLSADGTEPATHRGVNAAGLSQDQYDIGTTGTPDATFASAADWSQERLDAIAEAGSTPAEVDAVLAAITVSGNWSEALADAGVQTIVSELP